MKGCYLCLYRSCSINHNEFFLKGIDFTVNCKEIVSYTNICDIAISDLHCEARNQFCQDGTVNLE